MTEQANNGKKPHLFSREFDNTIFMIGFLILFGGYLAACVFTPFGLTEIADKVLLIFSATISAMATYFFTKAKINGNGEGTNSRREP